MADAHRPQKHAPKILLNSNNSSKNTSPLGTRFSSPTRNLLSPTITNEYLKSNKPGYKSIKIHSKELSSKSPTSTRFKPAVSFDTVAIGFSEGGHLHHEDENDHDHDHPEGRRGRSSSPYRARSPSSSPFRTRSPSPLDNSFGILSDIDRLPLVGHFDGNGWRVDYPSESAIRNNSFTKTLKHPKYQQFIKTHFPRTFIIYITGRQHTWVALDYFVAKLLRDGDHVVLVSRLPSNYTSDIIKLGDEEKIKKDEIDPKIFRQIADNLEKYVDYITDPNIIFKLTIDLYLSSSTADVLDESISIYEPELMITSTKPNLRFKRVTTWKTSRVSDRLVKNFDVPTMIVPAFSLSGFETKFFKDLQHNREQESDNSHHMVSGSSPGLPVIPSESSLTDSNINTGFTTSGAEDIRSDISSIISADDSDQDQDSDHESNSSFQALTKTITTYNEMLDQFAEDADEAMIHESIFLERLNKVSDISKRMAITFADFSNNEGEGGDLVRSLTGLPKLEKQKSMLDVLEINDAPSDDAINNLKKTLRSTLSPSTSISLSGSGVQSPKTIKFTNDLNSPDRLKIKTNTETLGNGLRRFRTNVDQPGKRSSSIAPEVELKPTKSQPGFLKMASESNVKTLGSEKKKKGFLKSIFSR